MKPFVPGVSTQARLAARSRRTCVCWPLMVAFALAACGSLEPVRPGAEDPETVTRAINLSGFPPDFRRGFTDGCTAAHAGQSGMRPKEGGQYGVGWHDGFDYCSPQKAH
jgi:hypothetical protein